MRGKESYPKSARLKSPIVIGRVFTSGKKKLIHPVLYHYLWVDDPDQTLQDGIKAGVTVSKRKMVKATDRNRIKRLLREAYRKHKPAIQSEQKGYLAIMMSYVSSEELEYSIIEQSAARFKSYLEKQWRGQ